MTFSRSRPRVALFTDAYAEANGVGRLSQALEAYAARRDLPLLCVHGGAVTGMIERGGATRLELKRGPAALGLDQGLTFDPLLWRHYGLVKRALLTFRPDVIHITGPSDAGQLGALLGHRLSVPMVGSWHTNLHEYAALRASSWSQWMPSPVRGVLLRAIERHALSATLQFYRIPRVVLAPNQDLVDVLANRTGRPAHLMAHGVDTDLFSPTKRRRSEGETVRIGFVGRLSPEKNVRALADIDGRLREGSIPYRWVVIGDGAERRWLETHLPDAEFTGVLRGEALSEAYASLDLFVFPSTSETFGLAALEAMASGVPVVAMARGGPRFFVRNGVSGRLAESGKDLAAAVESLLCDVPLRRRLGIGAREASRGWSWDRVFDDVYAVYEGTLERAASGALVCQSS